MKITNNVRVENPVVSLRASETSEALRRAFACSRQVSLSLSKDEAIFFRLLRHFVPRNDGRRNLFVLLVTTLLIILLATISYFTLPSAFADDWPQVQHDPQHTGYSPETLGTNFRVAWTYPFQPDRVGHEVQAIIYQGRVYVGTEGANGQAASMYALDAVNPESGSNPPKGRVIWRTAINEPIVNSVAADNGMIYFGTLGGAIYALDAQDGRQIWKQQVSLRHGFSTAPVLGDNKILIGGRDGYFYALNPTNGEVLWKYDTGSPILQTAAYNNSKVFFGTMDMYVYALNTSPADVSNPASVLSWKSGQIKGIGFKDYWPVVTQGRVIVRPVEGGIDWGLLPADYSDAAQTTRLSQYDANPSAFNISLIVLDENTGQQIPALLHGDAPTQHGAPPPPCVDRDGNIIVSAPAPASWQAGWARTSLTTRKIIQPLYDGTTHNGSAFSGYGNGDENLNVSCSRNLIINFHSEEAGAQYNGYFNLDTNRWTAVPSGRINNEMVNGSEVQSNDPPSISNGMVYHISNYELIARTTQ